INIPAPLGVPPVMPPGRGDGQAAQNAPEQDASVQGRRSAATALGEKLDLDALAEELERYVPKKFPAGRLRIDHDKDSGMFVYKTVDPATGEVLQQYPTDEMLRYISY